MDNEKIAQLIAKIDAMPTLPTLVGRVLTITSDPNSSADDLLQAIEPDQSMTVKILKVANSAFYSRVRKVADLKQALMVLGFQEVRNLVLASAVFNNFQKIRKVKEFDARAFWRHSFITGLAAKGMAGPLKLAAGEMFIAGLIHDIGKLALLTALPLEFVRTMKMSGNYGLEGLIAEKHVLGLSHTDVGMRVLKRWMFPNHLVVATGFHHQPATDDSLRVYPLVVQLSDFLAHIVAMSPDLDEQIIFPEGCFSAETASLAKNYGIDWHLEAVKARGKELKQIMDLQAGVLDAFLN
ncbi:MAG: HDOD domain-containing protein [Desulfobacteraceae bacterium]|nr:HDOD domain-containing protein [Desulfobacteraceae bacterium]